MFLVRPSKVRTTAASVRSESVAQRAVDAELIFSGFRGLGVARIRIVIVSGVGCGRKKHDSAAD